MYLLYCSNSSCISSLKLSTASLRRLFFFSSVSLSFSGAFSILSSVSSILLSVSPIISSSFSALSLRSSGLGFFLSFIIVCLLFCFWLYYKKYYRIYSVDSQFINNKCKNIPTGSFSLVLSLFQVLPSRRLCVFTYEYVTSEM